MFTDVLQIMEDAPVDQRLQQFFDYFVTTYLGVNLDAHAIFSAELWNHWDTDWDTTNNRVEGWHNRVNSKQTSKNPNIYKFMIWIREEQDLSEKKVAMLEAGQILVTQKRKFKELKETRLRLKNEFISGERSLISFLDTVKHTLRKCRTIST